MLQSTPTLGTGVVVRYAALEVAAVDDRATIGPFAYLRPGAQIGRQVKIGDFVEIKILQSVRDPKSRTWHMSAMPGWELILILVAG